MILNQVAWEHLNQSHTYGVWCLGRWSQIIYENKQFLQTDAFDLFRGQTFLQMLGDEIILHFLELRRTGVQRLHAMVH